MLTTGYAGTTCMYLAHHELESLLLLLIQQDREDAACTAAQWSDWTIGTVTSATSCLLSNMLLGLRFRCHFSQLLLSYQLAGVVRQQHALLCHYAASLRIHCWCRYLMRSPPSASSSMFGHRRLRISSIETAAPKGYHSAFVALTLVHSLSVIPATMFCMFIAPCHLVSLCIYVAVHAISVV